MEPPGRSAADAEETPVVGMQKPSTVARIFIMLWYLFTHYFLQEHDQVKTQY